MKTIHGKVNLGKSHAARLGKAGIKSWEALLEKAAPAGERQDLSRKTGISETLLLDWVKQADLLRIKGLEVEHCNLLMEAGVCTVRELASQIPFPLYAKIHKVNEKRNLADRLPSGRQVKDWIEQARRMPNLITY